MTEWPWKFVNSHFSAPLQFKWICVNQSEQRDLTTDGRTGLNRSNPVQSCTGQLIYPFLCLCCWKRGWYEDTVHWIQTELLLLCSCALRVETLYATWTHRNHHVKHVCSYCNVWLQPRDEQESKGTNVNRMNNWGFLCFQPFSKSSPQWAINKVIYLLFFTHFCSFFVVILSIFLFFCFLDVLIIIIITLIYKTPSKEPRVA